jgi:hypothetical protein
MLERRPPPAGRAKQTDPSGRNGSGRPGLGAQVSALQGAIGNAAMGRLVTEGAPRRLARFGEPEHKAIGDKALPDVRWRLGKDNPFTDLQVTFGEWVALGDWFEDIAEIKALLRANATDEKLGQFYYALLVKIRPKSSKEGDAVEKRLLGTLFNLRDKEAVDRRYADLKTRNIKHFPNPLAGDTKLTMAERAKRRRNGAPFGAIARYHADHVEAVSLAMSAAQLGEERLLGEALAMDGFACHFLTDAFSGSHTRTPRASIEEHWDKKVPRFDEKLVKWLADEVTYAIHTKPRVQWRLGLYGLREWIGGTFAIGKVREEARKQIRPVVPKLSFGDIVGLVVHDWEGEHGADKHGPLVEVAGQRLRLAGDDAVLGAVSKLRDVHSDKALMAVLKDRKRSAAERTFAGASLSVRASVKDVQRAYDLARRKGTTRSGIMKALTDKDGLFASERLLPNVVPDAKQPAEDHMPKWSRRSPAPPGPRG